MTIHTLRCCAFSNCNVLQLSGNTHIPCQLKKMKKNIHELDQDAKFVKSISDCDTKFVRKMFPFQIYPTKSIQK